MGINNDISLYYETQADMHSFNHTADKVADIVQKMEKHYLDPDTSRKIGVLKQQLRIQQERRVQLLSSLSEIIKTIAFQKHKPKATPKQKI